jgi:hypothetical protein
MLLWYATATEVADEVASAIVLNRRDRPAKRADGKRRRTHRALRKTGRRGDSFQRLRGSHSDRAGRKSR